MSLKQVILVRKDLKMSKGKSCVQSAHASVQAVLSSKKNKVDEWLADGGTKVVLSVKNKGELLSYLRKAKKLKLQTSLITDAGRTFFKKSTTTCGAIGPDDESKIDKVTGNLKMF